jgi:predicted DNA-binding transcriptional regulator AlpA
MSATATAPAPIDLDNIPSRMLSVEDLATLLHVKPDTIRQWEHRGEFPKGRRIGGTVRWHPRDVKHLLQPQEG